MHRKFTGSVRVKVMIRVRVSIRVRLRVRFRLRVLVRVRVRVEGLTKVDEGPTNAQKFDESLWDVLRMHRILMVVPTDTWKVDG